jgi:hypothetical protein
MATVEQLTKQLVGKAPSEHSPADIKRAAREMFSRGKVLSGFTRGLTGSAKAGDVAASAITAQHLAGVGRDGEFAEENAHQQERSQERRRQERERVEQAIAREDGAQANGFDDVEESAREGIVDAEPETQEWATAEFNPGPVSSRGGRRPVGLESVNEANEEYRRRRGAKIG